MGRQKQVLRNVQALPLAGIDLPARGDPHSGEALERLARSLRRHGQRDPVLVVPDENDGRPSLRLVHGRARVMAARSLGWRAVDGIVLDARYRHEIAVVERLDHGEAEPWGLTDALIRLKTAHGWTQHQLGALIGKSRDFVANILAIANIVPEAREFIQHNQDGFPLSARHLRFIGRTPPTRQLALAREIITQRLSTKALEDRLKDRPRSRREYLKVRRLRKTEGRAAPKTVKDWKQYYRQLNTDLRRIDRREAEEMKRLDALMKTLRVQKRVILGEARRKRRVLKRELRRAARKLAQAGRI